MGQCLIKVILNTKEANNNDRRSLSRQAQVKMIKELFDSYGSFDLDLRVKPFSDRSLHVRFVYIAWEDESEVLYQLDRGFDMMDERCLGRGCPVLKFSPVNSVLKDAFLGRDIIVR